MEDKSTWVMQIQNACLQENLQELIEILQSCATPHAGTAKAVIKNKTITLLQRHFGNSPKLYEIAHDLSETSNETAQEIGVMLLADFYLSHKTEVQALLHRLADSPHWEVREWVASACGGILSKHFPIFYPVVLDWIRDDSVNIRRAAVLTLMYAADKRFFERSEPILAGLEYVLRDRQAYVRDNLGPFALGGAVLRHYPEAVLARLRRWALCSDEQVRWHVATVFSTAVGALHAMDGKVILATLSADERPYVQKAVAKALKNLKKRVPQAFVE